MRKSKYNAKKVLYNDILFDSKTEMEYYRDYVLPLMATGEIIKCDRQQRWELQPPFEYMGKKERAIKYISDFDLTFKSGRFLVVDIKGMVKPMDSLKKKLFEYRYPDIEIQFIGKSIIDGGFVPIDLIKKERKKRKKAKEDNKND